MAFEEILESDYDVGKAVKRSLFRKAVQSINDHESRLNLVETGASKVIVANFPVVGSISQYQNSELKISSYRASNNFTLTEFSVTLVNMGIDNSSNRQYIESSEFGTLELDLKKSVDGGLTWDSVCALRPMLPPTPGSVLADNVPNGTIFFATLDESMQNIAIDDLLRIEVISKKQRQGAFHVLVYGELS